MVYEVAIIGAGPAGIAAAIQMKRYEIDALIFEKDEIGGLIRNANKIGNYPGYPKGISGIRFVELMRMHLANCGINVINSCVDNLEFSNGIFTLKAGSESFFSQYLVLATGTKPLGITRLKMPNSIIDKILHEVYPIINISDQTIAIIGGGDAAFDYALNLSRNNKVIILNRSGNIKALPLLRQEAMASGNISYFSNTKLTNAEPKNDKIVLNCISGEGKVKHSVDYLLFAIGREPDDDLIGNQIKPHYDELINSKKLFPIGDLENGNNRQASISIGQGTKAAMEIYRELNK